MARPAITSSQLHGTVVRVISDKGFAFIKDEQGVEYFCHRSAVLPDFNDLIQGSTVTFTPTEGLKGKGPRAEHVQLVS